MNRFDVQPTKRAEKDITGYKGWKERVTREILQLEIDPCKGHTLTGSLSGARSLEFSLPDGAHRAAYVVIEAERVCVVFLVGAHEGFYDKAERRFKALKRARLV